MKTLMKAFKVFKEDLRALKHELAIFFFLREYIVLNRSKEKRYE